MRILLSLFLALPACATITNVRTLGTTATQAVLAYTAPNGLACALKVSETPVYSPLVHDVDASLFSGSNFDSRAGNPTVGRARTFVVGQRLAAQGVDGNYYSRALQANTLHYYQISCGSDIATGTFTTANLPIGDTSVEQPPFDAGAPFNYAWPTISLTDKTKSYVDPMTGVLIKRMTGPSEWMRGTSANQTFSPTVFDLNSAWTNPNNAASGNTTTLATYSGAASDPLMLTFATGFQMPPGGGGKPGGWSPLVSMDDLQVRVYGDGSDASAANRTMSVCLSQDSGQTCATSSVDVVLPQTTPGTVLGPAGFPSATMSEWGAYLTRGSFMPRSGTVNVSGSTVTIAGSNPQNFNPDRAAGSRIYIARSGCASDYCTIASVQSPTVLTIVETSATLTGAAFWDAAPGLKAWKKTATGTVNVSFGFNVASSDFFTMVADGATEMCGHTPVTVSVDASGNPICPSVVGFMCMTRNASSSSGGPLYVVIPSTGEARLLSNFTGTVNTGDPVADRLTGQRLFSGQMFSPTDSTKLYLTTQCNTTKQCLFMAHYTGNFAAWQPVYSGTQPTDYITYTNLTPASTGMDILGQVEAANPSYQSTIWGNFVNNYGLGMAGKYYDIAATGGQDCPAISFFFDTSTTPATLAKTIDSFSAPTCRWGGVHTSAIAGFGDYVSSAAKQMADGTSPTRTFYGPHQMAVQQVLQNGSWTSNTAIAANYCDACPTNPYGGTCCESIKTEGEPCSHTPNTAVGENTAHPCPYNAAYSNLQPLAVGDWIVDGSHADNSGERLRVLSKVTNGDGTLNLVLQRGVGPCVGTVATSNGWAAWMAVTNSCRIDTFFASGSDPTPRWQAEYATMVAAHNDIGTSPTAGNITVSGAGGTGYMVRFDKPISDIGQPPDYGLAGYSTIFAGNNVGSPSIVQSYPSIKQWAAASREKVWMMDVRALNPSTGSGDEVISKNLSGTSTLVSGLTQTYVTPVLGGGTVNIKSTPLLGYAGPYLLQDISGPSSLITDSTAWAYCYAYKAGECRAGSVAGTAYTNVPKAGPLDGCYSNSFSIRAPCVFMASPVTSQVVQWDLSQADPLGAHYRKLTMGLAGWGRQYQFANARALPDGSWAILRGYWSDGKRSDLLLAKLPPWPGYDSVNRSTFLPLMLQLGAAPRGTDHVLVQFGYTPSLFCTTRQEICVAASSNLSESVPFWFATSDSASYIGVPCTSACTVVVAALPQRVVYYRVVYLSAAHATVATGPMQVAVVP
jgi:hypothetical protein